VRTATNLVLAAVAHVRYNLGILYECCNQLGDAIDAYRTCIALAPDRLKPKTRLLIAEKAKRRTIPGARESVEVEEGGATWEGSEEDTAPSA